MKGAGGIRKGNGEKVEGQSKRGIAGTGWREGGKAGRREIGKAGKQEADLAPMGKEAKEQQAAGEAATMREA